MQVSSLVVQSNMCSVGTYPQTGPSSLTNKSYILYLLFCFSSALHDHVTCTWAKL